MSIYDKETYGTKDKSERSGVTRAIVAIFAVGCVVGMFMVIKLGFSVMNMTEPFEGTQYEQPDNQITGLNDWVNEKGDKYLISPAEDLGNWINEKTTQSN